MSGFLFSFLSGIGEVKNRTVFFQEEASGKLESLRRRRRFGKKTSCGRKIQNERKRTEEKDLLWEKNLI